MSVWPPPRPRLRSSSERSALLGIPLLLVAELGSIPAALRSVTVSTGMYVSCLAVPDPVTGHAGPLPVPGRQPENHLCRLDNRPLSSWSDQWRQWARSPSTTRPSDCTGARPSLTAGSLTAVLKLAVVGVLVLAGIRTASGLLFAWALTLVVSLSSASPCSDSGRPRPEKGNLSHRVALARRYGVLSLKHHVLNLSINSCFYIVGVIAALLIPCRGNWPTC